MTPMPVWKRRVLLLLLATTTLPSLGCLAAGLVVAGAAAAGAGTYAYVAGRRVRDYPAGYAETVQATRASLADLGFPLLEQNIQDETATLVTETGNGTKVTIDLSTASSPIPSDGAITRVGVRVGLVGDEGVSERILDEINVHIVPAARGPRPGTVPGAIQPVSAELPLRPIPQAGPIPVREVEVAPPLTRPAPANWRGTAP